jgi:hypothetical protein
MADPPRFPEPDDVAAVRPDREPTTGPPRWVKVFGLMGLVLVVLIVIMLLTGHGPGRHMHGGLGGRTPPSSVSERGV